MNKKAFTVVELIITFSIVMTISIGLFKVVDSYREKQQKEMSRKETRNYRDEILKTIEDDVLELGIDKIDKIDIETDSDCSVYSQGIKIKFKNESNKKLCVKTDGTVLYGTRKFVSPSQFVKIPNDVLDQVSDVIEENKTTNQLYNIKFSIVHEELEEEFPINIVYNYSFVPEPMLSISTDGTIIKYNYNYGEDLTMPKSVNGIAIKKIYEYSFYDYDIGIQCKKNNFNLPDMNKCSAYIYSQTKEEFEKIKSLIIENPKLFDYKINTIYSANNINIQGVFDEHMRLDKNEIALAISRGNIKSLDLIDAISLESIGKNSFISMGIEEVTFPQRGNLKIEENSFKYNNIKSLKILDSVQNISGGAFSFTNEEMEYLEISANKMLESHIIEDSYIFPKNIKKAVIKMKTIPSYLFNSSNTINELVLDSTIEKIEQYACNRCKINNLSILSSEIIIEDSAFNSSSIKLETLTLGLKNISKELPYFELNTLKLLNSVEEIGEKAFLSRKINNLDLSEAEKLKKIGSSAFSGNQISVPLVIPDKVETIGDSAFRNNQISSLTIPSSVTTIGDSAFYNNQITTLNLNNATSLTTIGQSTFSGNKISILTIPSSVTTIGSNAFANQNRALMQITIKRTQTNFATRVKVGTSWYDKSLNPTISYNP